MVWKQVQLSNGIYRWLNEEAANAYIDQAVALSTGWNTPPSALYELNRRPVTEQIKAVKDAWKALGSAFKAMDLPPPFSPNYSGALADAYGFQIQDLYHKDLNIPSLVSIAVSTDGWMNKRAADVVAMSNSSAQRDYVQNQLATGRSSYVVRVWLANDASVKANCISDPNLAEGCYRKDGSSYTDGGYFVARSISLSGQDCKDPYDWQCVSFIGLNSIFPALVWSLDLCAGIATSLKSTTPIQVITLASNYGPFGAATLFNSGTNPPDITFDVESNAPSNVTYRPPGLGLNLGRLAGNTVADANGNTYIRSPTGGGTLGPVTQPSTDSGPSTSGGSNPDTANTATGNQGSHPKIPTDPQALLEEMHSSCDKWVQLSSGLQRNLYKVYVLTPRNTDASDEEIAGVLVSIDQYCQMATNNNTSTGTTGSTSSGNGSTGTTGSTDSGSGSAGSTGSTGTSGGTTSGAVNTNPLPTTATAALSELGIVCAGWNTLTLAAKAAGIKASIFDPRGLTASAGDVASMIKMITDYCLAASGSTDNSSSGNTNGSSGGSTSGGSTSGGTSGSAGGSTESTTPTGSAPGTIPSAPQALSIMNMSCAQWSKLKPETKATVYKSFIGPRLGSLATDDVIAGAVAEIDQFCVATNNAPPFTLESMGFTCAQWSKLTPTEKSSAISSSFRQKYNASIDAAAATQLVASFNATCDQGSSSTPGTGHPKPGTDQPGTGHPKTGIDQQPTSGGVSPETLALGAAGCGVLYWLYKRSKG